MTEEEINNHMNEHADMFADDTRQECFRCKNVFDNDELVRNGGYFCDICFKEMNSDPEEDAVQELTHREIKEIAQMAFEQGILRGITEGQNTVLDMINNDPEIDSDTAKYITHLVIGGDN